jgi:hypothetical protein
MAEQSLSDAVGNANHNRLSSVTRSLHDGPSINTVSLLTKYRDFPIHF